MILFALTALAAPTVTVSGQAEASFEEAESLAPGLGVVAGVAVVQRLDIEVGGHVALPPGPGAFDVLTGVRWRPAGRFSRTLSVVGHGGVRLADAVRPVFALGVSLEVPVRAHLGARIQATHTPDTGAWRRGRLAAGVVWTNAVAPTDPVEVEPRLVVVEPVEEPVEVPPPEEVDGTLVFVSHPVCEWVPRAELPPVIDAVGERPATGRIDGRLPVPLPDLRDPEFQPPEAVAQGSLVVAAWPGDVVDVQGRGVELDADAAAVLTLPEDEVRVLIRGGGREQGFDGIVSDGFALWLVADEARPIRVLFPLDSAVLGEAGSTTVADLARWRGSYRYAVQGMASPEGAVTHNQALAEARAKAVAAALVDAGVPEAAIDLLPPAPPDPALDVVQQRSSLVTPLPPEAP